MAQEGLLQIRDSFDASTDLSSNQYHFVNLDGSDELQLAGDGEQGFVLVNKPDAQGKQGTVILVGKAKVVAGGSINALDNVASDANGEAVTATNATVDTTTSTSAQDVAGDQVNAIALEGASSGDVFKVLVVAGGLV